MKYNRTRDTIVVIIQLAIFWFFAGIEMLVYAILFVPPIATVVARGQFQWWSRARAQQRYLP